MKVSPWEGSMQLAFPVERGLLSITDILAFLCPLARGASGPCGRGLPASSGQRCTQHDRGRDEKGTFCSQNCLHVYVDRSIDRILITAVL